MVICWAAAVMMAEPVSTLPVKLIIPIRGDEASARPVEEPEPWTTLMSPGGTSSCSRRSQNLTAQWGVSSLGLITIVLPVINAGPAFRAMRKKGKFHGRIPHHPDWLTEEKDRFFGAIALDDFSFDTPAPFSHIVKVVGGEVHLNAGQAKGCCSSVMTRARGSTFSRIFPAILFNSFARAAAGCFAHED